MRGRIIEYGPGKDVDPTKAIMACNSSSMAAQLKKELLMAHKALQQREEMRHKAIKILRTEARSGRATTVSIVSMLNAIDILEGIDYE